MFIEHIHHIMVRELRGMKNELLAYQDEGDIWRSLPGLPNTAGTVALHVAGNLQHFVGAQLGKSGYVRDREAEFGRRDVPVSEMVKELDRTVAALDAAFAKLEEELMDRPFPQEIAGVRPTVGDFLVHLVAHLAYHLGQIDYHRRCVTGEATTAGVLSPRDLKAATES
ncbi:MAG: DinB family protein [Thermoanaerobaculia bacterium]